MFLQNLTEAIWYMGKKRMILPNIASRSDMDVVNGEAQFISCENSMGVIQMSKGILEPVSDELMNENQIVCRMAKATMNAIKL